MKTYLNRKLAEKAASKIDGTTRVITFSSNGQRMKWVILVNGVIWEG